MNDREHENALQQTAIAERQARTAAVAAWISGVAAVAAVVGVVITYIQWSSTNASAASAAESLKASKDAVRAAEDFARQARRSADASEGIRAELNGGFKYVGRMADTSERALDAQRRLASSSEQGREAEA